MRVFERNGNWWIDYTFNGKRHRKKIGKSKKLAEKVLAKIQTMIIEKKYFDIKEDKEIKFKEMADLFLDNYAKSNKSSWIRDTISIKHLNEFFGEKNIGEITSFDIENYKKKRIEEGVKYATINRELTCLKTIFNKAVEWGKLNTNSPKIKLYKENNMRIRYLTETEANLLVNFAKEPLKSIIIIALNTGMRLGEIVSLRWRDIDFNTETITVWRTKNKEKKVVPMNKIVVETLRYAETLRDPLNEFVFYSKIIETGHISKHHVSHMFNKLIKELNIKDFRFHDLRHTFASWLVMKGVDLKTIQELLGHKTFSMVLRYAHLSQEHKKKSVELLTESWHYFGTGEKITDRGNNLSDLPSMTCRDGGKEDATDLKSVGSLLP